MGFVPSAFRFERRDSVVQNIDLTALKYAMNWSVRPHSQQWQSRVIESTMLRLSLGTIYVYNWFQSYREWGVIDGMERLIALHLFMTDQLVLDENALSLTSSRDFGLRWSDLKRDKQRRVEETVLNVVAVTIHPNAFVDGNPINVIMRHIRGEND